MGKLTDSALTPITFQPHFCGLLIEQMGMGYSFESFGGIIHVGLQTLYDWVDQYPEFGRARQIGYTCYVGYWEAMGRNHQVLEHERFNRIHVAVWKWHMARIRSLSRIDMEARVREQVFKAKEMAKMKLELEYEKSLNPIPTPPTTLIPPVSDPTPPTTDATPTTTPTAPLTTTTDITTQAEQIYTQITQAAATHDSPLRTDTLVSQLLSPQPPIPIAKLKFPPRQGNSKFIR